MLQYVSCVANIVAKLAIHLLQYISLEDNAIYIYLIDLKINVYTNWIINLISNGWIYNPLIKLNANGTNNEELLTR